MGSAAENVGKNVRKKPLRGLQALSFEREITRNQLINSYQITYTINKPIKSDTRRAKIGDKTALLQVTT